MCKKLTVVGVGMGVLCSGYVSWHYGDICAFVEKARAAADRQFGHPRAASSVGILHIMIPQTRT